MRGISKRGVLVTLLVSVFFIGVVSAGSVDRSFSALSVEEGGEVNVTLTVTIDDSLESYYYVQEEVPAGWVIESASENLEIDGQNITWAAGPVESPFSVELNYSVSAPDSTGIYTFEGVFALGSPILGQVTGVNEVEVLQGALTCTDAGGFCYFDSGCAGGSQVNGGAGCGGAETCCDAMTSEYCEDQATSAESVCISGVTIACSDFGYPDTLGLCHYSGSLGLCCAEPSQGSSCTDGDGDGWNATAGGECGSVADCNDAFASVNPGATEVCDNSIDDDCDGNIDEGCAPIPECVSDDDCLTKPTSSDCTYWSCNVGFGVCEEWGNHTYCGADGLVCNGDEYCDFDSAIGCSVRNIPNCDDGIECTDDSCDEESLCINEENSANCLSGEECLPDEEGANIVTGCLYTASSACDGFALEAGEECDGTDLGDATCVDEGYPAGGNLACLEDCTFNYSGCSLLPKFNDFDGNTTNFSELSDIEEVNNPILEVLPHGAINYSGQVINFTKLDLDEYVSIEKGKIEVDLSGSGMEELNKSAELVFYGVDTDNPRVFRDGVVCPDEVCNVTNYTRGVFLKVNVTGFSVYEVVGCGDDVCNGDESCSSCSNDCGICNPGDPPGNGGPGGGGGGLEDAPPEEDNEDEEERLVVPISCQENWVCTEWTNCEGNVSVMTRVCRDDNLCGTEEYKPDVERPCEMPALIVGGLRLDLIFAFVVSAISIAGVIVFVVMRLRLKGSSSVLENRKRLFESVSSLRS